MEYKNNNLACLRIIGKKFLKAHFESVKALLFLDNGKLNLKIKFSS